MYYNPLKNLKDNLSKSNNVNFHKDINCNNIILLNNSHKLFIILLLKTYNISKLIFDIKICG